jgi:hypothetical protein
MPSVKAQTLNPGLITASVLRGRFALLMQTACHLIDMQIDSTLVQSVTGVAGESCSVQCPVFATDQPLPATDGSGQFVLQQQLFVIDVGLGC